jgi:peptidoglycan hydrolase-like protein with peptidoglycan-binding domain
MRFWVMALLLPGFLIGSDVANAGLSTDTRDMSAAITPVAVPQESAKESAKEEATEETEDQISLDRRKRREVQRQLTRIGFDTKVNGVFDGETRAAIARWQAARGYAATGFLNAPEHESLLTESESAANPTTSEESDNDPAPHHRSGAHRYRASGPVGVIGGMIGGLFGRR